MVFVLKELSIQIVPSPEIMPLSHLKRPVTFSVPLPEIVPDRSSMPSTVTDAFVEDPVETVPSAITSAGVPAAAPLRKSRLPEIVAVEPDLIFSPISLYPEPLNVAVVYCNHELRSFVALTELVRIVPD